jgi:DNA modification methylase
MSGLYQTDLFGGKYRYKAGIPLYDKYIVPPFSVIEINNNKHWKARQNEWRHLVSSDYISYVNTPNLGIASPFSPVLCEVVYTWFCPPSGQVLDPFAGSSVRGVVASVLGYKYWGCELSKAMVDFNYKQTKHLNINPTWICGDSLVEVDNAPESDFIFSCPPYGDLEKYSNDSRDLSNMKFDDFISAYSEIIKKSVDRLKDSSFACFVVGDFRDKEGYYRNFVGKTIEAFEKAGARLYNEIILKTSFGSAAIRAQKFFDSNKKVVKVHQNMLVFCKGSWKIAAKRCSQ